MVLAIGIEAPNHILEKTNVLHLWQVGCIILIVVVDANILGRIQPHKITAINGIKYDINEVGSRPQTTRN